MLKIQLLSLFLLAMPHLQFLISLQVQDHFSILMLAHILISHRCFSSHQRLHLLLQLILQIKFHFEQLLPKRLSSHPTLWFYPTLLCLLVSSLALLCILQSLHLDHWLFLLTQLLTIMHYNLLLV